MILSIITQTTGALLEQAASTRNNRPVARNTGHELTFKPDQRIGADQTDFNALFFEPDS
jgi:hypothetical protein